MNYPFQNFFRCFLETIFDPSGYDKAECPRFVHYPVQHIRIIEVEIAIFSQTVLTKIKQKRFARIVQNGGGA